MDFHQLYYTSCRTGLPGSAGSRFNAVTPGVPAEVMSAVEALSSYEPPSTPGHSPAPAQIEGCPVNLCFVPGPRPIVACTGHSGFAHALVPVHGGSWPGPPPIALWRAGVWAREVVAEPELPLVRGPLPWGPLRRDVVDDFLDEVAGRAMLPALLAAAERAVLDRERAVVILAADADEVARWIAAVSFLLPPPLVGRMSFATYQFRPSGSRHHLIGTLPGAEIVADERAFQAFYLFDFTAGACSEVEVGPVAQLLAAAGAVAAESLWRQAVALGVGREVRLADWYAPVVAAALLDGGVGVGPADLDAVCGWLGEHAVRLGGDAVGRIGAAALEHDAVSAAHLAGLADAAAAGGLAELLALTEQRLLATQIADALAGERGATPGTARALRSVRARESARQRYDRALAGADAAAVVRLLDLAAAHEVRPDARVLRDCGLRAIGPELLRSPPRPGTYEAVKRWPDLRAGVLECLDRAAAGGTALYAVFEAGLDAVVPGAELAASPALHEAALIAHARRHPERRVDTALSVLAARGLDEALLRTLWPDGWSLSDARAMLMRLPAEALGDPVLAGWVAPLLDAPFPGPAQNGGRRQLESYGALCDLLTSLPLAGMLPIELRDRLRAMARIRQAERQFVKAGDNEKECLAAGDALLAAYDTPGTAAYHEPGMAVIRSYLRIRLVTLLAALPPDRPLAMLLARMPSEIREDYLAGMRRGLEGEQAIGVAVTAFVTLGVALRHQRTESVADAIEGLLLRRLPDWRRRDLNAVERELRRSSNRIADDFKRWRQRHCRSRPRWLPSWPVHS
ncbi:GTPase-associated protein 1-related protein [Nonomuraea sp. H19]|uniref:GTPase-associated protein 1-related protein n=1 Tax=Nonomuraea sp. H19 TaxID=3452206 RepID=UPI003F8997BC